MDTLALISCAFIGLLATPFGLLPSVLLFRDLANGLDTSASRKRAYGWSVWGGLGLTWLVATALLAGIYAAASS